MAVHDQCGPLGQNKTGVFIAIPPGQLSTSKVDLIPHIRDVGSEWLDPSVYGQGFFAPDNVQPFVAADMNCPTFGLGVSTDDQGLIRTTIGPPWLPLIVPPSQALSLDPAWLKYCTGILSYSQNLASFGVFDPPHALVPDPAGGLVRPSESQPTPAADPEQTRIQPGQSPTAATPSATSLFDAPTHNDMFAAVAKVPAFGLLPQRSRTPQAAPSQAGEAAPATRQDTIPQGGAPPVKTPSDAGLSAGDQTEASSGAVGRSVSTLSSNASKSGNSPPDTSNDGSQPNDPGTSQQHAGTVQGNGGTDSLNSNNGASSQQNEDPATNPVTIPQGGSNAAEPVAQGASPYSTPSSNGNGAGSQAGVKGGSPAGSPVDGVGSSPDISPAQQGIQGVNQPTEGGQAGLQGSTPQGSNGQGVVPQSSSNEGEILQASNNQVSSPQDGENGQVGPPSGVEEGSTASVPANGPASNQMGNSAQQVNQGAGQQDPGLNQIEGSTQQANQGAGQQDPGSNQTGSSAQQVNQDAGQQNPGSNQIGSSAQQVDQDAGQQDPGVQPNAQGITPQGTSGDEAVPQGSGGKEPMQQASDGQVLTPQDSSGSNGGLQSSEQATQPFNAEDTPPTLPAVTIAGQTFNPNPSGFELAGQAVKPGGPGIVVSGTPVSLAPSGTLIVGGSAIPLSNPAPQVQPLKLGGESFVPKPEGFNVGEQAVRPGGPAVVIAGTPLSLAPSGTLYLGGSTIQLVQAVPTEAAQHPQLLNVGGKQFVPNPTGFVVAGQSVKPGGPAVNIVGTPVSLAQDSALYVGSSIIQLDSADAGPVTSLAPQNVVNIGGKPVVAFPTGFAVPGGSNIIPGGPAITVASTPVSLGSDGILHVGTSAIPLSTPDRNLNGQNPKPFNVGSFTFTPVAPSATGVMVEGTTILPNSPPQTVHGTTISLDANNDLFVNGTRITIPTGTNNNNFNVGNLTFTAITTPAGVSVDGIRILPGETALDLRGKNITVDASGGLAVGGTAVPIPQYSSDGSVLQVGNLTFSALSRGGGVVVDGITILPNATAKVVHGVSVKLDAGGNLVVGNVSMAAPTGLAAATGTGNMVESTKGPAGSGGIITDNAMASTSATAMPSGVGGPIDNGGPDNGNAAPTLRVSWAWMMALLLGNAGLSFLYKG